MDLGIEVILSIFSKEGLTKLFDYASQKDSITNLNSQRIFELRNEYINSIESVIKFLQNKNGTLARQINSLNFLPQASRFETLENLDWAFGNMGIQDQAKHLATLYLEDISDFIVDAIDDNFGFSRYAEKIGRSANSFNELNTSLSQKPTYIDFITLDILAQQIGVTKPKLVCSSVPFPGNLYSAFRCAQWIKRNHPMIKIAMGGGFPNTELRSLTDSKVFDYFDFITLDDRELPIELLHKSIISEKPITFKRTFILENGIVSYKNDSPKPDYKQAQVGTPDYSDLLLNQYISVIEIANPMHSLWTDGRWNKLTMVHGCYWAKCSFCDVSLDYIKLYEPLTAKLLVDRIQEMIVGTGETGFHFVDEAGPPALMRELALEIIRRDLKVTWWTNIRFEKSFSKDLCNLLAASGCIAVSGGLEVASDRLLKLIEKGTTVEQVAQVTRNLTEAGVMVHAYLMFGYPTQTVQETIHSLEMVRQLFKQEVIQSGFWHQFSLTAHSPIGLDPDKYGVSPKLEKIEFANSDVEFSDKTNIDHSKLNAGLKKSLYNYMHGVGFELSLQDWFEFKVPKTKITSSFIEECLAPAFDLKLNLNSKIIFLGNQPSSETKGKKSILTFHLKTNSFEISLEKEKAAWLVEQLAELSAKNQKVKTLSNLKISFESKFDDFEPFWFSKSLNMLKENSVLII